MPEIVTNHSFFAHIRTLFFRSGRKKIIFADKKIQLLINMKLTHKDENTNGGRLHNTLAAGTTVKGNIATETDFRLDGEVEGDIICSGKIVIGEKGSVTGNIRASNAEILGKIKGSVQISGKLTLKASASIDGDLFARQLEIEPNARFNGVCKMSDKPTAAD